MWHLRLMILYLPAVFYVYVRLRRFFHRGRERVLFSLLFLLLALAFPLVEPLAHRTGGAAWQKGATLAGYLALPYLLYLLLAIFLFDLGLALRRLVRRAPARPPTERRLLPLLLLLGLPLLIVGLGWIHHERIQVSRYRISVPRRAAAATHLRLVMAADFHLRDLTSRTLMKRFVERVNALRPDIILIPGDVLEGDRWEERTREWQAQLRGLRATYGVFASMGNHEGHGGGRNTWFIEGSGIRLLQDESVVIDRSFCLVGRRDNHNGKRKTIPELLASVDPGLPVILLDHRPTSLREAADAGVDILLSAHTHHGQLFPFNIITRLQYGLSWGYRKKGGTHIFVTCGLQCWGPPVRTAGIAEIMLIDVDLVESK